MCRSNSRPNVTELKRNEIVSMQGASGKQRAAADAVYVYYCISLDKSKTCLAKCNFCYPFGE